MRKCFYKKIIPLLLAIALIYTTGITALAAHAVPDLDETGSITVTMQAPDTKEAVPGGTLALYQAGDVLTDDGNYSFALTDAFSGSGLALEDVESAELAASLAEYAETKSLVGENVAIGADGTAVFTDLKPGLYLLVQTQAADDYYAAAPFLVTVPVMDGEAYVYDVDATPKMEQLAEKPEQLVEKPQQGTTQQGTTQQGTAQQETSGNGTPAKKVGMSDSTQNAALPQTGQLNWPIPVLAVSGLLLFAIGWMMYFAEKRKNVYAH